MVNSPYAGLTLERANARNVSFRISLRWPIHIINPVDKTQLSRYTSHRRSTTVSLETYPSTYLALSGIARDCCSVTSRILEIRSVSSKLCFFRLLSSMFRFVPPLFFLAPHDLILA